MKEKFSFEIHINGVLKKEFIFFSAIGKEKISRDYYFKVEVLSLEQIKDVSFFLGSKFDLRIFSSSEKFRCLFGRITSIQYLQEYYSNKRYLKYRMLIQSSLWYLNLDRNFRIWQDVSVPEIVMTILGEENISYENKLVRDYFSYDYCVQYQESTLNFLNRIMEKEGIYYFFESVEGKKTLILCDSLEAHQIVPDYEVIYYQNPNFGLSSLEEGLQYFTLTNSLNPNFCISEDYNYLFPKKSFLEFFSDSNPFEKKICFYDWAVGFSSKEHGSFLAKVKQESFSVKKSLFEGKTTCLGIHIGKNFVFEDLPLELKSKKFLVVEVYYEVFNTQFLELKENLENRRCEFSASFKAIPSNKQWRTEISTPVPKTFGPQTAEVVGPKEETIWTDRYGRVKLNFRWNKRDQNNSCWIRVASSWAGWKYGCIQIPRIGEEVIVDFINGNPDYPIIIGRVYNRDALPPWDLPENSTRFGIVSRSSKKGINNSSHLFLEDSPGKELFSIHAERDMNVSVEKNYKEIVEGNFVRNIFGNSSCKFLGFSEIIKKDIELSSYFKGKSSFISVGISKFINGIDYLQSSGNIERVSGKDYTIYSEKNLALHSLNDLYFFGKNRIFYGKINSLEKIDKENELIFKNFFQKVHYFKRNFDLKKIQDSSQMIQILFINSKDEKVQGNNSVNILGKETKSVMQDAFYKFLGTLSYICKRNANFFFKSNFSIKGRESIFFDAKNSINSIKDSLKITSKNYTKISTISENIDSLNFSISKTHLENSKIKVLKSSFFLEDNDVHVKKSSIGISSNQISINNSTLNIHNSVLTIFF